MEAADFVNKLLQRKPANRLGFNSPAEVKNHQWLRDINWQEIIEKKAKAPFIPEERPPLTSQQLENEKNDNSEEGLQLLRRNSI
jgi:hypothetical protein